MVLWRDSQQSRPRLASINPASAVMTFASQAVPHRFAHARRLLVTVIALWACGEQATTQDGGVSSSGDANASGDRSDAGHDAGGTLAACAATDCAPSFPSRCMDGSSGNPRCTKQENGTCAWEFSCSEPGGGDAGEAADAGDAGQGATCGGFAGAPCPDGQYCNLGKSCRVADAQGRCAVQPQICTGESNPVCGCDGDTYGNPCAAAAAGVSVYEKGGCYDPGV